jgi:hypothetical protein
MFVIIYLLGTFIADLLKSRRRLEVENLFLRQAVETQAGSVLRNPATKKRRGGRLIRG